MLPRPIVRHVLNQPFPTPWCCFEKQRYPGRLSDLERYFGREYSQLSRLFRWPTDFLFEVHSHRVMDNMAFWGPHLRDFARAVYRKGGDVRRSCTSAVYTLGAVGTLSPGLGLVLCRVMVLHCVKVQLSTRCFLFAGLHFK